MHPIWNLPVPGNGAPDYVVLWEDFGPDATFGTTDGAAKWDTIITADGTVARSATIPGGAVVITGDSTAGNPTGIKEVGASFVCKDGYPIYFSCRLKTATAATADWLIGLMTVGVADPEGTPPTNGLYFGASGDANIDYVIEPGPGGTQQRTDTGKNISDDDWVVLSYMLEPSKATVFVDLEDGNGPTKVATLTGADNGLPANNVMLAVEAFSEGGAIATSIDWIWVAQRRVPT